MKHGPIFLHSNAQFSTNDKKKMFKVCEIGLRALALGNANAKCKGNLAFQVSKCSASGNASKFFCNTAAVHSTFRISL